MNIKKYSSMGLALAIAGSAIIAIPVLADTTSPGTTQVNYRNFGRGMMRPGVFGTVLSVNGNTITMSGSQFTRGINGASPTETSVTYTVDATSATILKTGVASTLANISVNDKISVQGTINGTNIVATAIHDGVNTDRKNGMMNGFRNASSTPIIQGDGQPIIGGTISTINGTTLTIKNNSNVVYTIDASNAKIAQGQNTILISNLNVGDSVIVQGSINGTSVVATGITDQMKPLSTTTNSSNMTPWGFFGGIGHFFAHLFGF